jgi:peptidoglycan-associated lipoprotein
VSLLPLLLVGAAAIAISASAPKPYVVLLESPDGTTGEVIIRGSKGEQTIRTARFGAILDGSTAPSPVSADQIQQDFGEAMSAQPELPAHYILYFGSGTQLTAESETLLPQIVASANARPMTDISVIGHTDTVGPSNANELLASQRAASVVEILKARGLKALSLQIESHGKSNPLLPTPDETLEPRNRGVEISIR